jgi:hypothetical protein
MLLRQCLQELRFQRGEVDALIPACYGSGREAVLGDTQASSTEISVVAARSPRADTQFAVPRLARASDSARAELALAA